MTNKASPESLERSPAALPPPAPDIGKHVNGEAVASLTVALAGNPNSGKTSIFNTLTGAHQHVGNWGGVTVEVKEGTARSGERAVTVVDLPGTYSLSAYSLEERVARDYLVEAAPDVVIQVIDATNLERHLYLTVQLLELGVRPLLAFNMWDEVQAKGLRINIRELETILGLRIVTTVGRTGKGVHEMLSAAVEMADSGQTRCAQSPVRLPRELARAVQHLSADPAVASFAKYPVHWTAVKLLESDQHVLDAIAPSDERLPQRVAALVAEIEHLHGEDPESLIAESRYGYIAGAVRQTVKRPAVSRIEISDRIDRVLTHPILAYPIFLAFMWLLFQATFTLGTYPAALLDAFFSWLASATMAVMPDGLLQDLVVEGGIRGVGSVAAFLPNILILFLGISLMEDSGYMARAAFIMDKFMHSIGLHGKSFVPVIMGMGCSVPAIMAARTLESPRDRIKTILLTPLISCSARLPVYVLFAGALFPKHAGAVVFLFNFVFGLAAFFGMGLLFHKTLFRGEDHPFVMELPPYRTPTARSVVIHMWQKAAHYVKKMGGVVLVFTVIVWALGTFPRAHAPIEEYQREVTQIEANESLSTEAKAEAREELAGERDAHLLRATYLARIGGFLEPAVAPLGFEWQEAVSLLTGFVAKEIIVSSMGVMYAVGDNADAESEALRHRIAEHFTPLTGVAFMMFVLLYTPCLVAFVTIIRELHDWRWSLFSLSYQIALAWGVAFLVYQGGRLVGLG
jgi:ferrous iron transport protein B